MTIHPLSFEAEGEPSVLVLGAGWSSIAGVPLTRDLLRPEDRIFVPGQGAREYEWSVEAFRQWGRAHPGENAEQFLLAAFRGEVRVDPRHALQRPPNGHPVVRTWCDGYVDSPPLAPDGFRLPWSWAAHAVQVRVAQAEQRYHARRWLYNLPSVRYRPEMLLKAASAAQEHFWRELVARLDVTEIVSTNYDLRTERVVGAFPTGVSPGFRYGGIDVDVRPVSSPYRRERARPTQPMGSVPFLKLHGSLNWSVEDGRLVVYPDLRPVWRRDGTAAIIPPLPEKEIPHWLDGVWTQAALALRRATRWVVVGYSLPPYDFAMNALFGNAAADGRLQVIELHDPSAALLGERYAAVAPRAEIVCHPGLSADAPVVATA